MRNYETKSLEEIRFDDYQNQLKPNRLVSSLTPLSGGTSTTIGSTLGNTDGFGSTTDAASTTPTSSMFGAVSVIK